MIINIIIFIIFNIVLVPCGIYPPLVTPLAQWINTQSNAVHI